MTRDYWCVRSSNGLKFNIDPTKVDTVASETQNKAINNRHSRNFHHNNKVIIHCHHIYHDLWSHLIHQSVIQILYTPMTIGDGLHKRKMHETIDEENGPQPKPTEFHQRNFRYFARLFIWFIANLMENCTVSNYSVVKLLLSWVFLTTS